LELERPERRAAAVRLVVRRPRVERFFAVARPPALPAARRFADVDLARRFFGALRPEERRFFAPDRRPFFAAPPPPTRSGLSLREVEAISSSWSSDIDSYIALDAPLRRDRLPSPRFAASAAPAAFCCAFDFAGMSLSQGPMG
jgi:hypothetical protein